MIRKAVISTALKLSKPVLSLTNSDYKDNGIGDLLVEKGDAYEINLEVYYMLRDTITGWPGGKPNVNLPNHPERSVPYPKRSIIFLPTPTMTSFPWEALFSGCTTRGTMCTWRIKPRAISR